MKDVFVWDYGSGNIRSVARGLERAGASVTVGSAASDARGAAGVVVPGVGAFAACMAGLTRTGGDELVRSRVADGRPVLGICVGMQMLFETGDEHGVVTAGLGLLGGRVRKLSAPVVPHMGWNTVSAACGSTLLHGLSGQRFYFVHSYAALGCAEGLVSWAEHGERFAAAVEHGPLAATQFHPEKSGAAGRALLENWVAGL